MGRDKNDYDKAYDKGYNKGKSSGFIDDIFQANKDIVPLPKGKHEDSYDAGYEDGKSDRHSGGSSNYSGGSESSDSGCFITTATIQNLNKADDCSELMSFRNYRDTWLSKQKGGDELIKEYYKIAPPIVEAIASTESARVIYKNIWNQYLSKCYMYIKEGENEKAKSLYSEMVMSLSSKFLF